MLKHVCKLLLNDFVEFYFDFMSERLRVYLEYSQVWITCRQSSTLNKHAFFSILLDVVCKYELVQTVFFYLSLLGRHIYIYRINHSCALFVNHRIGEGRPYIRQFLPLETFLFIFFTLPRPWESLQATMHLDKQSCSKKKCF